MKLIEKKILRGQTVVMELPDGSGGKLKRQPVVLDPKDDNEGNLMDGRRVVKDNQLYVKWVYKVK